MLEWIGSNEAFLWWVAAMSAVSFAGSLIVIPILVMRLPADYFTSRKRRPTGWKNHHPILRFSALIVKNVLGVVFVLAGMAMLVLPGQGIVTILIGVVLLDFPKKFAFERWLLRRRPVHRAMSWIRTKAARPPLDVPTASRRSPGVPFVAEPRVGD